MTEEQLLDSGRIEAELEAQLEKKKEEKMKAKFLHKKRKLYTMLKQRCVHV